MTGLELTAAHFEAYDRLDTRVLTIKQLGGNDAPQPVRV